MTIMNLNKSIIPACDVTTLDKLRKLVVQTADIAGIGGYKIGFALGLGFGLPKVADTIRENSDKPIIYDHQKAGTDIPFTASVFVEVCKAVDAVIFFPQAGPETQKAWIEAAQKEKLGVIVGGEMTHKGYLAGDGGYLTDDTPKRIYELAAKLGVTDFVVPGNKPEKIKEYKQFLESLGVKPVFYSPGLVAQGGQVTESAKAAGDNWHAIVGRGIYKAEDMKKAAEELCKGLL